MGKTWVKIVGAFTILAGLIALAEWLGFEKEWKFAAHGFVLGLMVVALPMIWAWDSPYRHNKLERERLRNQLVQVIPRREERLRELRDEIDAQEIRIADLKHDAEQQRIAGRSIWKTEWAIASIDAEARKKESSAALLMQKLVGLREEHDRVEALTDEQWRDEQVAKIYVPE